MQNFSKDPFKLTRIPASLGMQEFENNFNCLLSNFSGGSAPPDPAAFMQWYDTSHHVMKIQKHDKTAWLGLFHGDEDQKIWMFKNDVIDGWEIEVASDLSDAVCGVKGGSTYTTGGSVQGEWSEVGLTHNHPWSVVYGADLNLDDWSTYVGFFNSEGDMFNIADRISNNGDKPYVRIFSETPLYVVSIDGEFGEPMRWEGFYGIYFYTSSEGVTDLSWRPKAAVGTIQFLSFAISPAGDDIEFYSDSYDNDGNLADYLMKIEANCEALKSCRCANNHTSSPVTGELWGDYLNKILRVYDGSDWQGLMHADESCIIWVYRNDTLDGWVQHTQVDLTDCLLAVQGGSTYTTAGTIQGDAWSGGGINTEHNHSINSYSASPDTFKLYNMNSELSDTKRIQLYTFFGHNSVGPKATDTLEGLTNAYTTKWGTGSGWRPKAAIGTLQYLDLTD